MIDFLDNANQEQEQRLRRTIAELTISVGQSDVFLVSLHKDNAITWRHDES